MAIIELVVKCNKCDNLHNLVKNNFINSIGNLSLNTIDDFKCSECGHNNISSINDKKEKK